MRRVEAGSGELGEGERGGRAEEETHSPSPPSRCPDPRPPQAGGGWPLTRPHYPCSPLRQQRREGGALPGEGVRRGRGWRGHSWDPARTFTHPHNPEPWLGCLRVPSLHSGSHPHWRYHNPGASLGSSLWGRLERLSRAAQQGEPPPFPREGLQAPGLQWRPLCPLRTAGPQRPPTRGTGPCPLCPSGHWAPCGSQGEPGPHLLQVQREYGTGQAAGPGRLSLREPTRQRQG